MVFFTCQNCGDTLKKDVAQHVGECRGPFPLTCIYCKEEFYDDRYTLHSSCASEVPDVEVREPETKKSISTETKRSSEVETRPSDKVETTPPGKMVMKSDWICAIDRVSQAPSLTPQQSSLLAALANLHNVPKKRPAFVKFALRQWKDSDANEAVVDEVFHLINKQTINVREHWSQSLASGEPAWVVAMRAACKGRLVPPMHKKIHDKVLSYQKSNPVPLSLPNYQSLQNLVSMVCKDPNINKQVVNEMFDSILLKMVDDNNQSKPHGAVETTAAGVTEEKKAKSPVEEEASKKKKRHKKQPEDVAENLKEAEITTEEVTKKKSKKKKHKRQEENSVEDEDVPREKSSRSA